MRSPALLRFIRFVRFLLAFTSIAYLIASLTVSAQNAPPEMKEMYDVNKRLCEIAGALAILLIGFQGFKYLGADNPQERDDAKKGMVYVVIGLIVVALAGIFVSEIYCATLQKQGYDVTADCDVTSICMP